MYFAVSPLDSNALKSKYLFKVVTMMWSKSEASIFNSKGNTVVILRLSENDNICSCKDAFTKHSMKHNFYIKWLFFIFNSALSCPLKKTESVIVWKVHSLEGKTSDITKNATVNSVKKYIALKIKFLF